MPGNMTNFTLDMIRNRESLNIFTDVSTRRENCCYGAVAVHMDDIIDQRFITHNNCSNSGGEIRGIRTGLSLGFLHRNDFRCINIFSDSVYAIKGIKEWFFGSWYYNPIDNRLYTATNKTPVAHQSVFIECTMQLDMLRKTNIVNIYHIKVSIIGIVCTMCLILDCIMLKDFISIKGKRIAIIAITAVLVGISCFSMIKYSIEVSKTQYISKAFYGCIISEKNSKELNNNSMKENIANVTNYIKNNKNKTIVLSPYSKIYSIVLNYCNGILDMPFIGNLGKEGEEGMIKKITEMGAIDILLEKNEDNLIYQESKRVREYIKSNYTKIGEIEQFDIYEK